MSFELREALQKREASQNEIKTPRVAFATQIDEISPGQVPVVISSCA